MVLFGKQLHKEDPQQLKRELLWLASRVGQHKGKILTVGLLGLVSTILGLSSSVASKYLIDAVMGHGPQLLKQAAACMVLLLLGSLVLQGISSRVGAAIHVRVKNELQHSAYGYVLRADWQSLESCRSGDLLNRLHADVNVVSDGILHFLPSLVTTLAKLLGAFGIILYYDPVMALITLLGVPLMLVLSRVLMRKMRHHNLQMKELNGQVMSFQEDSFRNLTSIKAFSLTAQFEEKMRRMQDTYTDAFLSYHSFQIGMSSFLSLVSMVVTGSCFGWGVYQLWNGRITYGSLTLFLQLASMLRSAFSTLVSLAQQLISLTTSAGRIMTLEALPEENRQIPEGLSEEEQLEISLKQVSFRYHTGERVLEAFDFNPRHGDLIAVTGTSGEGKTTLLRLLLGLVEPDSGTAELIGGTGRRYPLCAGTRSAFAYVPQGSSIFSGTIAENLRLVCPDAGEEELEAVLKIACAWEFVSQLPGKLQYNLGTGGRGISEGQAQRLAIARALLRKAPVLLLDEATSGLDIATERQLLHNLRHSRRLRTCILVTHRPESARFCSRIYEIHNKQVTEVTAVENR